MRSVRTERCRPLKSTVGPQECVDCPLGRADLDRDASTPCELLRRARLAAEGASTAPCGEAMYDYDSNPMSPCINCPGNHYAEPGSAKRRPPQVCVPGTFQIGVRLVTCDRCPAGRYDHDSKLRTMCVLCGPGHTSSSSLGSAASCVCRGRLTPTTTQGPTARAAPPASTLASAP
eukprot:COSAG01_NODE_759_length_13802_cov_16.155221_11_plen_175_part_00